MCVWGGGWGIWRRQINYFSETWHFCNKNSANKLEMVNKRVLRFVFRDKSSPDEELCRLIGLSSLREQRLAKVLSTVFKLLASDAGRTHKLARSYNLQ